MNFLTIDDLDTGSLHAVLARAGALKADPGSVAGVLGGMSVGLFFEKPSTRTLVSSDVGVAQLGAHPVPLTGKGVGLGSREAPEDVGRTLDRYLDAIAMRVKKHAHLEAIAAVTDAPVINMLSNLEHPCQALADLQTMAEHGPLTDLTVAYVGDAANNVARSLIAAARLAGMTMRVAAPPAYGPDVTDGIEVTTDAAAAVAGADVVYTDVWISMGDEGEKATRRTAMGPYQVNEELFGTAAADAIFLHCLPAHRGNEVTDGVIDDPRSRVFDQAENRLHSFKAILLHVLGK